LKSEGQCSELLQTRSRDRAEGAPGLETVTKSVPAIVSIVNIVKMYWFLRT